MVETENFIKEIREEVRKDKLFKTLRRYKWALFGLIFGVILAVSGYEYYKYTRKLNSESNGQLLAEYIKSIENETIEDLKISSDSFVESIAKLHKAKFLVEKGDLNLAKELYEEVIKSPGSGSFFKKYSTLMLYLLSPAESLSENNKINILDKLSAPDSPFQILALEQKLILFLKLNDIEKAKNYISLIVENPGVTSEQLERIKEVKELYGFD